MSESESPGGLPLEHIGENSWSGIAGTVILTLAIVCLVTIWIRVQGTQIKVPESFEPEVALDYPAPFGSITNRLIWRRITLYTMDPSTEVPEYRFGGKGERLDRHEISVEGPTSLKKIWFLGNSAGQGLGIPESDTVPAIMNDILETLDVDWRFTNLAQGGFASHQEMLLTIELLRDGNRPDAIVILDGILEQPGAGNWNYNDDTLAQMRANEPPSNLFAFTDIWEYVVRNIWPYMTGVLPVYLPQEPTYPGDWNDAIRQYLTNLAVIKGTANAFDIPLFIFFQPVMEYEEHYALRTFSNFERTRLVPFMATNEHARRDALYDPQHAKLLNTVKGNFEDLYDVFSHEDGRTLYLDPRHPNRNGNLLIAKRIIERLEPLWPAGRSVE